MIKIIDGDLLTAKTHIIAHQVNCQGAFNSGVAKSIREHNYDVYKQYHEWCQKNTPEKLLGTDLFVLGKDNKVYANLFAQEKYGYDGKQYTNLESLYSCFQELKTFALTYDMTIAMPYKIGCVRGGADWNVVYEMIQEVFNDYPEVYVELWRWDKG